MPEDFADRPENSLGRKLYNRRFEKYRDNIIRVEECFKRYGVRRVQGPPGEELRERAVRMILDMQDLMMSDRLPISDHYAVIPNYYGTYTPYEMWEDEDDEFVFSKTENAFMVGKEDRPRSGSMRYIVGLEAVMRDFRNYEALYEPLAVGNLRYLRHPCNCPLPPVEPNEKARTFDIPLGYIGSFAYDSVNDILSMSVVGQYKERMKLEIEVNRDPEGRRKAKKALSEIEDDIE